MSHLKISFLRQKSNSDSVKKIYIMLNIITIMYEKNRDLAPNLRYHAREI